MRVSPVPTRNRVLWVPSGGNNAPSGIPVPGIRENPSRLGVGAGFVDAVAATMPDMVQLRSFPQTSDWSVRTAYTTVSGQSASVQSARGVGVGCGCRACHDRDTLESRMPTISETDIDSILEISGVAVECAAEAEFPPALFRQMTELFGSKSCVYYSMSEDLDNHPIWDGIGYNLNGARVREYEDHYRAFDPCFAGLRCRAGAGSALVVSTDQVIGSERGYVASGYYRDFLRPQRIHNSIIFAVNDSRGMLGLFGFHRAAGKPVYGADEHLKARLLARQSPWVGLVSESGASADPCAGGKFMERAASRVRGDRPALARGGQQG